MTDRWRPTPLAGDGPDGRGEAGPPEAVESRRETEEAARSGRFPSRDEPRDVGELRDDSNPIEPEDRESG